MKQSEKVKIEKINKQTRKPKKKARKKSKQKQ